MRQCWDNEPKKRPTASHLYKKLNLINLIVSEDKRWKIISNLPRNYVHPKIHPEAYYTSRILYFPELSNMKF